MIDIISKIIINLIPEDTWSKLSEDVQFHDPLPKKPSRKKLMKKLNELIEIEGKNLKTK